MSEHAPRAVHYMHLVDHAATISKTRYKRPFSDRALAVGSGGVSCPIPPRFRLAAWLGPRIGVRFARLMPMRRLRAMLENGTQDDPPVSRNDDPQASPPRGSAQKVALMNGCAQKALNTDINDAPSGC